MHFCWTGNHLFLLVPILLLHVSPTWPQKHGIMIFPLSRSKLFWSNPKEGLAQCHSHSLLKRSANNGGLLRGFVVVTTRNIWKSLILTHAIARPLHMLSVSLLPYNPRTFLPSYFFFPFYFLSFFLSLFFFSTAIRSIHLMDSSQDPHNIRLHTSHHH